MDTQTELSRSAIQLSKPPCSFFDVSIPPPIPHSTPAKINRNIAFWTVLDAFGRSTAENSSMELAWECIRGNIMQHSRNQLDQFSEVRLAEMPKDLFCRSVVPTITTLGHGGDDPAGCGQNLIRVRTVLKSLIGVKDQLIGDRLLAF